jgi:hypothetical protein
MTTPSLPLVSDLAPGDARSGGLDLSQMHVHRIRSIDDPHFAEAYDFLWAEFGAKNEMERRETLAQRFRLAPAMVYEILLVQKDERFAAVRDHTVIPEAGDAIVHLSHNLVAPEFRRSGLAGWMRAWPIATAREVMPDAPVTLVAEMEYPDGRDEQRLIRLRAYERGGFRKVDPQVVRCHQPDFRTPKEIDATGGPRPLPFQLCLRQIGHENPAFVSGARLRHIMRALYRMYGAHFRPQDMAHPDLDLSRYPSDEAEVALIAPTA